MMVIQFNKVTWYSKLAAVIVLLLTILLAWHFYREFKEIERMIVPVLEVPQSGKTVSNTGDVQLKVGEFAIYQGLKLSFDGMVADNRCPVDVQCIEGGAVTARVTMTSKGKVEKRNFPSDEVPYRFGDYAISIVRAFPEAHSQVVIDPKSYEVVFNLKKVSGN